VSPPSSCSYHSLLASQNNKLTAAAAAFASTQAKNNPSYDDSLRQVSLIR